MTRGQGSERGSALTIVLLVAILFETALIAAVWQIHSAASRARMEDERTAAYRLAEAGVEHALALGASVNSEGRGRLAGGTYTYSSSKGPAGQLRIKATGRHDTGRSVTIELAGYLKGGELVLTARQSRHFFHRG